ncbi:MAG: hypothetical protein OEZ14_10885, partial [Acidimicrobiia bacterium]|nr:hypothetical protein [Acidimicrobiia bacterium]
DTEDLFRIETDVFVPAALENQLTLDRAKGLPARVVVEAANGPTTREADEYLFANGVDVIPDILANSGGVIVSYFEWLQNKSARAWSFDDVDGRLRELMWLAHDRVVHARRTYDCTRRDAAYIVALDRIIDVYDRRGIFP